MIVSQSQLAQDPESISSLRTRLVGDLGGLAEAEIAVPVPGIDVEQIADSAALRANEDAVGIVRWLLGLIDARG
ncbi:MAG: hypothetical protein M3256_27115, partial [Actinomycetota bacterium]|nr:hypothetical protein [Actinomycetota bacterium]